MTIEWRRSDAYSWDGYVREYVGKTAFRPVLQLWVYRLDTAPFLWRYLDFHSSVDFETEQEAKRYAELVHRLEQ